VSEVVLGIQLTADGKQLVGEVRVSAEELKKLREEVGKNASEAQKFNNEQKNLSSTFWESAKAIGAVALAYQAFSVVKDYIKDAALLNARYQELGVTMAAVGRNAGYGRGEMEAAAAGVQKLGITMNESRESVSRLVLAQINLADASKLARVAQDVAIIGAVNSSEAFGRLVYAIQSGQHEMLKTLGINVNFEDSYKKLSAQLKVTTGQLTEQEMTQARANAVLEAGTRYADLYKEAMGTASKQIRSLARYEEDLKNLRGQVFNEALIIAVNTYTDALKDANEETRRLGEQGKLKEWGRDLIRIFAFLGDQFQAFKIVAVELATPIERLARNIYTLGAAGSIVAGPGSLAEKGAALNQLTAESQAYYKGLDQRLAANRNPTSMTAEADKFFAQRDADAARSQQRDLIEAFTGSGLAGPPAPGPRPTGKAVGGADMRDYVRSLKEQLEITKQNTLEEKVLFELEEKRWKHATPALKEQAIEYAKQLDARRLDLEIQKSELASAELLAAASRKNEAAIQAEADAITKRFQSANQTIKQIEFETSLIGLSNEKRETSIALHALETSGLDKESEAYKNFAEKLKDAISDKNAAQLQEDMKKKSLDEWKDLWSTVERTGKDAFVHLMSDGTSAFQSIGQAIKTSVIDLLYQLTARKWIINIGTSVAGSMGLSTAANAAGTGGGGGLGGLSSLGNLFSGGGVGSMVQSLGVSFGSQGIADIGTFLSESGIGTAIPYVGAALALASAFGLFGGGGTPAVGTGYKFSGGYSRGGGVTDLSVLGLTNVGPDVLRSDKWKTKLTPAIGGAVDDMERLAGMMGLDTSALSEPLKFKFKTGMVGDDKIIAAAIGAVTDSLALKLLPHLKDFAQANESLTQTFTRLAAATEQLRGQQEQSEGQLRGLVSGMPAALGITALQQYQNTLAVSDYLAPTDRLGAARSQYADLLGRAGAGDLSAVQAFPGVAQQLLGIGRDTFASGPEFADLMREVNRDLSDVLGHQQELQTDILSGIDVTIQQAAQDQIGELRRGFKAVTDELQAVQDELRRLREVA
jgi:hypothetical protein